MSSTIDIYLRDMGQVTFTCDDIVTLPSTHVDKPIRQYEIWKNCQFADER